MLLISGQVSNAASLDLSEQNLVSCTNPSNSPYNGYGCNGGWVDNNINYVYWRGQVKEANWPYSYRTGACDQPVDTNSGNAVSLSNAAQRVYPYNSANGLRAALENGPVGINLMADSAFMSYRGGIYQPTSCTTTINHAVLLVGYDLDPATGQWYWLVKNSWGTYWGENGYGKIRISTESGYGPCGMYRWSYQATKNFDNPVPLRT
eukprot:353221-Chlamydomonas_euryale.AAC.1